ncbi:coiled-coil domain-containing protein 63-like [Mya arenaria]|uniref:coiled-coil domain-containing protein 63-like n=1 Tax=Mya arenaria TaxID=6604 RepID=UPI0022E95E82|nr:coiled-coil domain-containing protein 63-like [Mya arenaria]
MPVNPGNTAKRSVCDDDAQDEFQMESELRRLQRQLHVMEGDRRAYSEESCNLLRKQQAEIEALHAESEEIGKVLRLARSERNQGGESRDIERLLNLIDRLDECKRMYRDEERETKQLDTEIQNVQELIAQERKLVGSVSEQDSQVIVSKRLRVTENRLDQELIKFNKQLATNARLREELDHLRQEKAVFDAIYRRLTGQLEDTKRNISDCITQASHAYDERDEAQTKMIALKERSDKDNAQQEVEMKELLRIIRHDDRLKEFMGVKSQDRADLREEEHAKKMKGKTSTDGDSDMEKHTIRQLEDAFARITAATGEGDIGTIVADYIRKEDQNFALYNFVNEQNDAVEALQEEISALQTEIARFRDDEVKFEQNRHTMIREMEITAERYCQEMEEADKKNTVICKVLDEIRVAVENLFKEAGCDSSTICDMLGSEQGVTYKNILQYMGLIEQRTMELIKIQQYIQMKKEPPKQERKDGKSGPATPASQNSRRASPRYTQIAIVPPHTGEEEELLDESELRPLTRKEIKDMVMKNLGSRIVGAGDQRKRSGKRNKQTTNAYN